MRADGFTEVGAAFRGVIALCALVAATSCAEPERAAGGDAFVDESQPSDAGRGPAIDAADAARVDAARPVGGADAAPGGASEGGAASDSGTGDSGNALPDLPPDLRAAGVRALFPARASERACPDAVLRISFAAPPTLGTAGKVQVFDVARPGLSVASLDMAKAITTVGIGGTSLNVQRPAYVDGNSAVFYLPANSLAYGHEYLVQVDVGVVIGPNNAAVSIADDAGWRFRTQLAAPKDLAQLSVAFDGSGDFCSLQGALDAAQGSARIVIARGTYHGIVRARAKHDLTLHGADRKATILTGTNNEMLNAGTAKRALISLEDSSNIVFENLTIQNLTAQGGSQAEALRLERCDKCIVRDADILSLQDTLLWSGRIYARNVLVAGNVDFIWGTGAAYFDRCEIKTLGRKGYNVQARNAADGYGYVFVDSKLTSDPGITGQWLARVDASVYPASQVAYVDCELGDHIDPAGFQSTGSGASLRFGEYQSRSPSGALVDVSKRASFVKQLSSDEAALLRDPKVVLGGWAPPP